MRMAQKERSPMLPINMRRFMRLLFEEALADQVAEIGQVLLVTFPSQGLLKGPFPPCGYF